MKSIILSIITVLLFAACDEQIEYQTELVKRKVEEDTISLQFLYDEIISPQCKSCHGGAGGFGFDDDKNSFFEATLNMPSNDRSDESYIVPFEPDASYLFRKLTGENISGGIMPTSGPLPAEDVELIRKWIEQGALNN
jgi:hypothetical protein